jgi:TonB family protein
MNLFHRVVCGCVLLPLAHSVAPAQAISPADAAQHLRKLSEATSLDRAGLHPWHLRMTFQLNDSNGKTRDSGTIDEWWVSPTSYRIEVKSPALNETYPASSGAPVVHNRTSYLVHRLLQQVVHPVPDYGGADQVTVTEAKQPIMSVKTDFRCFQVSAAKQRGRGGRGGCAQYCAELNADVLRIYLDAGGFADVRNRLATFQKVSLALDNYISYGNKQAIIGHVEALEGYDAARQPLELASAPKDIVVLPGLVAEGNLVKRVAPVYSVAAQGQHIFGEVLLCAIIDKEGKVTSFDVVTSPDSLLTNAAIDAVKQWQYKPYLVDGEPVAVDTTITVHFDLRDEDQ